MVNEPVYKALLERFRTHFGRDPEVTAYAPGRIEVLGNHTDYNEGFVLSAAINFGAFFAAAGSRTGHCRLVAGDLMKEVIFDVRNISASNTDVWQNYVKGTLAGLAETVPVSCGFNGMFFSNIPLGSGLSSSAALEMSTGLALGDLYGIRPDHTALAKIGQKAEHVYAGCRCGLLDQITSLKGQLGKLVKIDFRSMDCETVDPGPDACFLICNTRAKHALADGAYNMLRKACEQAAVHFAGVLRHPVHALRDVNMTEWAVYRRDLPEAVANRAAHPIGENERVLKGVELLARGDLAGFGALMFDSHESSRVLFKNSCEELDIMVDAARKIPGVLGARLSGGGFGGSVVALVHLRDAEMVCDALAGAYAAKYGSLCDVYRVTLSAGAYVVGQARK